MKILGIFAGGAKGIEICYDDHRFDHSRRKVVHLSSVYE